MNDTDESPEGSVDPNGELQALLAEYAEVNNNFRLLTEIRFKLLAFLPLAPAAAVAITVGVTSSPPHHAVAAAAFALCVFGLAVTMGLATYNARNDQISLWHVERSAGIERELGLSDGSFAHRPNAWFEIFIPVIGHWHVGHVRSMSVIYSSSIALWLLASLMVGTEFARGAMSLPDWVYVVEVISAVIITAIGRITIRVQQAKRRDTIQKRAQDAISHAEDLRLTTCRGPKLNDCKEFIAACVDLMGRDRGKEEREEEVARRLEYYGKLLTSTERNKYIRPEAGRHEQAIQYVALMVDLPPSWITETPHRRPNTLGKRLIDSGDDQPHL